MNVKELIEALQKMPPDARVFRGWTESGHGKEGYTLFDIDPEDLVYRERVWSFGNNTPRPPSEEKNVVIFEG